MYRISLPQINDTKLVSSCITALSHTLNKKQFIKFITTWYGARNPPGSTDYSTSQEWQIFKHILSEMIGCAATSKDWPWHVASMSSFNAEEPKKRRKNDEISAGTDEDWQYMSGFLHGTAAESATNPAQNLSFHNVDSNACLFKSIPSIFYALHLIYEDFKLDDSLHEYLEYLAYFLHQLAIDMQLSSYIYHYQMDFPELLHKTDKACLLNEQHGAQMENKQLLQVKAPSIYEQLNCIIKDRQALPYTYVEGINNLSRNVLQVSKN